MAILSKLEGYLKENNIDYEVRTHAEAFTAQEIAASQHVPGKYLAKVVMLKADNRFIMAVVQAHCKVDLEKIKSNLGAKEVRVASEEEFRDLFPDCEAGAMPPFGRLYDLRVLVDECISHMKNIYFNAGNHTDLVKMKYEDYARLAEPELLDLCTAA